MDNLKYETLAELRKKILDRKGCNLIVGTGINNGLTPSWSSLINSLINYMVDSKLHFLKKKDKREIIDLFNNKENVYTQALVIKQYLGKQEYIMVIRDEIYKNYNDYNDRIYNSLIPEISALCKSNFVKSILSVNYDDYLENFLIEDGLKVSPVYNQDNISSYRNGGIPIYYIHGYIGRRKTFSELFNQEITFSIDEYLNLSNNPLIWQNIMPLYNFFLYPSIFLGTSLDDINLLRMIELSQKAKEDSDAFWFKSFKPDENPSAISFFAKLKKINCVNCGISKINSTRYKLVKATLKALVNNLKIEL